MTNLIAAVVIVVSGTTVFPKASLLAHQGASDVHEARDSSGTPGIVEIIVHADGHPFPKGPQTDGHMITLIAGQPAILAFRNEDTVPRQFVSPLFTRADVHFAGKATGVFRKDAVGFRLNPKSTLILEFTVPYTGFPQMYDLIWCSYDPDGTPHGDIQELVVVRTQEH